MLCTEVLISLALKIFYSLSSLVRRGFFWQCFLSDFPAEGPLILPANGHQYWVAGGVGGILWKFFVMIGLTADSGDHFKNQGAIPLAPCMCYDLKGLSHEIDFKIFYKIYRTQPKYGMRLVFEFFRGFNDFKKQKVYLLQLIPVYVGLTMVSCLF
jgi:hypothetical protein